MIQDALVSRLPFIAVTTDDPLNVSSLLEHLSGRKATQITLVPNMNSVVYNYAQQVLYTFDDVDKTSSLDDLYKTLFQRGLSLVFVNAECQVAFHAGHLTCPPALIGKLMDSLKVHPDNRADVEVALSGLTLKEAAEVCQIAAVTKKELTQSSVLSVRRAYYGSLRGLQQVSLDYPHYLPSPELTAWVQGHGAYWKKSPHSVIAPRGIMFTGPPGTGKTLGAKYLAKTLSVPLYRLDMGAAADKYYGETEKVLLAALEQAENCSPCCLLIDEVEKFFNANAESSVVTRVMGLLLWWLQEHRASILTVMTTNREDSIPPEMYRPGRIDAAIKLHGVACNPTLISKFMFDVLGNFPAEENLVMTQDLLTGVSARANQLASLYHGQDSLPQSLLVREVHTLIMKNLLDKQN